MVGAGGEDQHNNNNNNKHHMLRGGRSYQKQHQVSFAWTLQLLSRLVQDRRYHPEEWKRLQKGQRSEDFSFKTQTQEVAVSWTHRRSRLQGRGCGERRQHVSALKDTAQCVSHVCPAGGATVNGTDVHGERLTVSVCQKVSTMGHFFSPTTL